MSDALRPFIASRSTYAATSSAIFFGSVLIRSAFSCTSSRIRAPRSPSSSFCRAWYISLPLPLFRAASRHVRPVSSNSPVTIFSAIASESRMKSGVRVILSSVEIIRWGSLVSPARMTIPFAMSRRALRNATSIRRFGIHSGWFICPSSKWVSKNRLFRDGSVIGFVCPLCRLGGHQ